MIYFFGHTKLSFCFVAYLEVDCSFLLIEVKIMCGVQASLRICTRIIDINSISSYMYMILMNIVEDENHLLAVEKGRGTDRSPTWES